MEFYGMHDDAGMDNRARLKRTIESTVLCEPASITVLACGRNLRFREPREVRISI